MCVTRTWNEISIRFLGSVSPKNDRRILLEKLDESLYDLQKAFKPVGHYYLCYVQRDFYATEVYKKVRKIGEVLCT